MCQARMNLFVVTVLLVLGLSAVLCAEGDPDAGLPYPQDDCLYVCTKEYEPVCGRNSNGLFQTFSSKCFLYFENCRDGTDYEWQGDGDCSVYQGETNEASPPVSADGEMKQ